MFRFILFCTLCGSALLWANPVKPIIIAHRGASGYLPEHTLAAKAMAFAQGADYLEQDVVLTKDGVPIVLHDIELDTTTDVASRFPDRARADGRYYAIDFTLAEIRQLRAHERIDLDTGLPVFAGRFDGGSVPLGIPTLAEEIDFIESLNRSNGRKAGIYVEIKQPSFHEREGQDIARIVFSLLRERGYDAPESHCFVQCFESATLRRLRDEFGAKVRQIQLIGNERGEGDDYAAMRTPEGLAKIARYADGIGPSLRHILSWDKAGEPTALPLTAEAQAEGLLVHPYTLRRDVLPEGLSEKAMLQALFEVAGVDGVFTDFPDSAVAYLAVNPASR